MSWHDTCSAGCTDESSLGRASGSTRSQQHRNATATGRRAGGPRASAGGARCAERAVYAGGGDAGEPVDLVCPRSVRRVRVIRGGAGGGRSADGDVRARVGGARFVPKRWPRREWG